MANVKNINIYHGSKWNKYPIDASFVNGVAASNITDHLSNTSNPHSVTKSQVGLGSVVNADQSAIYATKHSSSNVYFTQNGAYNMYKALTDIGSRCHILATTSSGSTTIGNVFYIGYNSIVDLSTGAAGNSVNVAANDIVICSNPNSLVIGRVTSPPASSSSITIGCTTVYVSNNTSTCIQEGTKIMMADGSYKNVEDVQQGDLLMSYDFEKKEKIEAVCLLSVYTSENYFTNYLLFDNDHILPIDLKNSHEIYDVTTECFANCTSQLKVGHKVMDISGNEVEYLGPIDWASDGSIKKFYNIVSSNNCYYANDLLIAHDPFCKKSWLATYNVKLPEELSDLIEKDSEKMKEKDYLVKNPKLAAKMLRLHGQITKLRFKMDDIQKSLTRTDYVAIKKSEGVEVDENIITQRANERAQFNEIEASCKTLETQYDKLRVKNSPLGKDILLSEEELSSKLFKAACKRDNEALDIFKKYFVQND